LVKGAPGDLSTDAEADFFEILRQCIADNLRYVFGDGGARVVMEYTKDARASGDIAEFSRKLRTLFMLGSEIVERNIVNELYRRLDLRPPHDSSFSFEERINEAKDAFIALRVRSVKK
jgi:hypothetical protein